jgi:hypothetical protein
MWMTDLRRRVAIVCDVTGSRTANLNHLRFFNACVPFLPRLDYGAARRTSHQMHKSCRSPLTARDDESRPALFPNAWEADDIANIAMNL